MQKIALQDLMSCSLPRFLDAMDKRLEGKTFVAGYETTIADFALGSFFMQTVCNENSPNYELFVAEFAKYENCLEFVKHFHDDNLSYIESMSPSFF